MLGYEVAITIRIPITARQMAQADDRASRC